MEGPDIPAILTFNTSALLGAIHKLYPNEFKSIIEFVVMAVQLGAMNAAHPSDAGRTLERLAAYPKFDVINMAEFGKFHRFVTGLTPASAKAFSIARRYSSLIDYELRVQEKCKQAAVQFCRAWFR